LTATDPDNLPPTIQSRAQKILFKPLSIGEISKYLEEKYQVPPDRGGFAARLAEGSLGKALDFISDEDETSFRQTAFLMFKGLFIKDTPAAVATVDEFINPQNRGETGKILLHWQSFLSDLILLKFGSDKSGLINSDLVVELDNLTSLIPANENFGNLLDELKKINLSLRRNVHIRPAVASLVIRIRRQLNQSA
jgi:DNA polymerase-3 subunit delta'